MSKHKLRGPLFSLGATGRLARAYTLARRLTGPGWLLRGRPANPNTPPQQQWRHMYQKAVALWIALSAAEQYEWERDGTRRHMTGFAWFMSQALRPNPGLYLPLQGGTMSGNIDMGSNSITDLSAPALDNDAARKAYVDHAIDTDIATHAGLPTVHQDAPTLIADHAALPNVHHIPTPPLGQGARVRRSTDKLMTTGSYEALNFDTEDYDNDGLWNPGDFTDRLTFQTPGIYLIIGQLNWAASAGGRRLIQLKHSVDGNIGITELGIANESNVWRAHISTTWPCLASQYVGLYVYQSSGGDLYVATEGREAPVLQAVRIA